MNWLAKFARRIRMLIHRRQFDADLEEEMRLQLELRQEEQLESGMSAYDPSLRGMAPEDYFVFRDQSRTFQDIGIYAETDTDRDVNVTGFAEPERVHALDVTLVGLGVGWQDLWLLPDFCRACSSA